ncbi:MAG: alanine--tRNA ligase, partial [bacterium]
TTAQKCIRTEDIDQVGQTARHLTFFEMLGNFSFGDYFKEEAIQYGWDFLVEEMDLNPDRLWITVFGGDDELDPDTEAEELWRQIDGVTDDRILHLGREENFWAMGKTGPCGPCSEILYDQESTSETPETVKQMILDGEDRILELWNLVFMEFQRPEPDSELEPLPEKNIDTGLGLERLAAIKQGAESNFGTDLFVPLMDDVREMIDRDFNNPTEKSRGRVIADHLRASSFLLSEGLLPGNEGRGYVLRRLIRRAHLRGRRLGLRKPFLAELVSTLIDIMGEHFNELVNQKSEIEQNLTTEEEQFQRILDQGLDELDDRIETLRKNNETRMAGRDVFELYETHGLPIEMTKDVLDEEGITYNEDEIEQAREEHEERSRDETATDSSQKYDFSGVPETEFTGYDELECESEIVALYDVEDHEPVQSVNLDHSKTIEGVFDKTPFYAEGGGQSGDRGWINGEVTISNTTEHSGRHIHRIELPKSYDGTVTLEVGQSVTLQVEEDFRRGNMRHHTATHLLHHALRRELGDQVIQDGSALDDKSLRFDFTYNEALDDETLDRIEQSINEWIYREIPVETELMDRDEAEQEGALAFFGEHYGQQVRVVMMVDEDDEAGPDSKEFCGGTHLANTAEVGLFTITNETAVAAGVRRIEARAGKSAYNYLKSKEKSLRSAAGEAGVQQYDRLDTRIEELLERISEQEKEIEKLRQKQSSAEAQDLLDRATTIGEITVVSEIFDDYDSDTLKHMLDELMNESDQVIALLAGRGDENVQLVLGVSESITDHFNAGDMIQDLGSIVGGGGGGRPDFAQAGGSRPNSLPEAIDRFQDMVEDVHAETAGH